MKKTIIFIALLFVISLLFYGCKDNAGIENLTAAEENKTQEIPAQPSPEMDKPANETKVEEKTEKEENFPLQYNLAQLNEFLPQMDYLMGSNAPASDVIAVTNMKTFLIYKNITTGEAKLTDEVENYKRDEYIIVGSPCDNPAAADLFKKDVADKGSCKIFPEGEGVIKLKAVSNNHFMLYIGGNGPAETKKAATVVQYFGNYTLTGTEARVRGAVESPVVSVVG